jgi:hypothetical protein
MSRPLVDISMPSSVENAITFATGAVAAPNAGERLRPYNGRVPDDCRL